jgi:mono/diheme cytochrome c family protein
VTRANPLPQTWLLIAREAMVGAAPDAAERAGMKRSVGLRTLLLVVATGCSSASHTNSSQAPVARTSLAAVSFDVAAISNGQSIFQTGRDSGGTQIVAQPRALFPSCAACHRVNGSGGVHLPGGAVSADLRYKSLVSRQTPPYTIALIERAVSTGIDNRGQSLNPVMPRWTLSKRDLHDVAYYVLTKLR